MTELIHILDTTARRLAGDDDAQVIIGELCMQLNDIRLSIPADDWKSRVKPECLSHPLRKIVHQDPYTLRAFEKPRGYAGDAVMLDYVYVGTPPEDTTDIGKRVFHGTTSLSNGLSVIERRDYLAKLIDHTTHEIDRAQILSVACGHLREAQMSKALREGRMGRLIALDQDVDSLAVVEADKPSGTNIVTVNASVVDLLRGKICYHDLNLIYATGLYDYLNDALARRLTATLFKMLAPKGKLVLANYTPDSQGRGYMEAFMDWFLVYRDEVGLEACAAEIPMEAIREIRTFREKFGNIVFTEILKEHP